MIYPNGRTVFYDYSGNVNDALNRVAAIKDNNGSHQPGVTLAAYSYLGLSTIVTEDYQQPGVELSYAANNFAALDQYGRVVDQAWTTDGQNPTALDEYTYGYDTAGNRLWRQNAGPGATGLDQLYSYDGLYQLTDYKQGTLAFSGGVPAITTPGSENTYTLNALGNWSQYTQASGGSTVLDQARTDNAANQIGAITNAVGSAWATPAYDQAGNMTSVPSGSDPTQGLTCIYDAWNRLAEVDSGTTIVAKYCYDGLGRRIEKLTDFDTNGNPQTATHYYLDSSNQVLETRVATGSGALATDPSTLPPQYQYVWSQRYIDAPILRDNFSTGATYSRLYYLGDANYNVTALVGQSSGTWHVVERYGYDAYGTATVYTPSWGAVTGNVSTVGNTRLFAGMDLDPETGLYYDRARYYDAALGTFVSRDPLGYKGRDLNLYRYVHNCPTTAIDPTGLKIDPNPAPALPKCCSGKNITWNADWQIGMSKGWIIGTIHTSFTATGTDDTSCVFYEYGTGAGAGGGLISGWPSLSFSVKQVPALLAY